jgi:hypothetical protein
MNFNVLSDKYSQQGIVSFKKLELYGTILHNKLKFIQKAAVIYERRRGSRGFKQNIFNTA